MRRGKKRRITERDCEILFMRGGRQNCGPRTWIIVCGFLTKTHSVFGFSRKNEEVLRLSSLQNACEYGGAHTALTARAPLRHSIFLAEPSIFLINKARLPFVVLRRPPAVRFRGHRLRVPFRTEFFPLLLA